MRSNYIPVACGGVRQIHIVSSAKSLSLAPLPGAAPRDLSDRKIPLSFLCEAVQ